MTAEKPFGSLNTPSVLIVDDQPAMRQLLERMVRLHGFRPFEATTGTDALAMAEQAPVDAFVIDLHLGGGLSGLQLLGCLRRQFPERATPVLILTGDRDLAPSDFALIERYGAVLFYKGEPLAKVMAVLQSVLGRGAGAGLGAASAVT